MLIFNNTRTWIIAIVSQAFFIFFFSLTKTTVEAAHKLWNMTVTVCMSLNVCLIRGGVGWSCVGVELLTAAVQISLLVPTHKNLTIQHRTPLDVGESHLLPQTKPHLLSSSANPSFPFFFFSTDTQAPLSSSSYPAAFLKCPSVKSPHHLFLVLS